MMDKEGSETEGWKGTRETRAVEECGYIDQWLRSKDSLSITAIKAPNPHGQQAAREKMIGVHFGLSKRHSSF